MPLKTQENREECSLPGSHCVYLFALMGYAADFRGENLVSTTIRRGGLCASVFPPTCMAWCPPLTFAPQTPGRARMLLSHPQRVQCAAGHCAYGLFKA